MPPPGSAPARKRGLGCLGCGCLILALIVVLVLGLLGAGGYFFYTKGLEFTSTKAASIPPFNGDDGFYQGVKQKIADFDHDLKAHQSATIRLNGDEINAVLGRDPYLSAHQVHLFVSIVNDQAFMQGSLPMSVNPLTQALFSGRYLNFDGAFGLDFNSGNKSLNLILHRLQVGDQTVPDNSISVLQSEFTPILNAELQKDPDSKSLMDQAKSIRLENGELVIETQ